ncbi:MAG: hypothetical protein GY910_07270 [bacterium]|nr:hypothetical protein [Deltaproteobacteria bacterium]MCP4904764.1 hypothetical protein [bacterium]
MSLRRRVFDHFKPFGLAALWVATLGVAMVSAGAAHARTETIRWTHPETGRVANWEAYVGTLPGVYDRVVQLASPQPDGDGVFESSIEVADGAVVFIALRAIGESGEQSLLSNARERFPADPSGSQAAPAAPELLQIIPVTQ